MKKNSLHSWFKQLVKKTTRKLLKFLFKVEVKGLKNYPHDNKPLIIIANHVSLLDGIILSLFLPKEPTFAVDITAIEKWWAKWSKKFSHMFSIDSSKPMAIKSLIAYVSQNHQCVIFPEGRISITGGLMKIYAGPGLVADRANADILPIHIEGAELSYFSKLKKKQKLHFFPKIKITIFPPRKLAVPSDIKGKKRRQILSDQLYDILCDANFFSQDTTKLLFDSLIAAQKVYGRNKIILQDITYKTLNYQQLIMRCFLLAEHLETLVSPYECIGIFLPNANAYVVVFFALQLQCAIPTLLNLSMSGKRIVTCCQTSAVKTILTTRKLFEIPAFNEKIVELQNNGLNVVFIDDFAQQISFTAKLKSLLQSFFPETSYQKWQKLQKSTGLSPSSTAVILFTSGSEGAPKGVALSYQNIQSNRFQLRAKINFTPQDHIFNALPLFHVFSLNAGLLVAIFSGLRTFLYPTPLHLRKIPDLCYNIQPTILFSTDTFLANYGKFANPYDFHNLRYVFAGAEKLKESTYQLWLNKFGLRIFEGYGTTETSPILAANTPHQNKPFTVGKLMPAITYQLRPVNGIEEGGELCVKGPNIMQGYLETSHPGKITSPQEGWHVTGDVARFDTDGFLIITDRLKRFAKIGGEMISLTYVETCISKLWPEFYHAALAIADARKGEQILLITTCTYATKKNIIDQASELGLSNLAIPKKIEIIEKMPLLSTGKINYSQLKSIYQ